MEGYLNDFGKVYTFYNNSKVREDYGKRASLSLKRGNWAYEAYVDALRGEAEVPLPADPIEIAQNVTRITKIAARIGRREALVE